MTITHSGYHEPSSRRLAWEYNEKGEAEGIPIEEAPDMAGEIDGLIDILHERAENGEEIDDILAEIIRDTQEEAKREIMCDMLIKLLVLIADSPNPRLEIEVIIFAAGLPLRPKETMSSIAARFGITRAAFSARVNKFLKRFDLPKPRGCKSKAASAKYKLTNKPKQSSLYRDNEE